MKSWPKYGEYGNTWYGKRLFSVKHVKEGCQYLGGAKIKLFHQLTPDCTTLLKAQCKKFRGGGGNWEAANSLLRAWSRSKPLVSGCKLACYRGFGEKTPLEQLEPIPIGVRMQSQMVRSGLIIVSYFYYYYLNENTLLFVGKKELLPALL